MRRLFVLSLLLVSLATSAQAQWTLGQWNLGANGHFYSVQAITGPSDGWLIARSQAQALVAPNGAAVDLATLTSASEDTFVFNGINSPTYWIIDGAGNNEGPNLGGLQFDKLSEPAGHWSWVTGEAWSFTNWSAGSPNNQSGIEDYLTFFGFGNARSDSWNDIESGTSPSGTGIHYYVAETKAVSASAPEPGTVTLIFLGATLVAVRRRRK